MRLLTLVTLACALAPLAAATLTDPLQNDAGTGGDAGDAPTSATKLGGRDGRTTADGDHTGTSVLVDDPADWYSFNMNEPGPITLRVATRSPGCALRPIPVDLSPVTVTLRNERGEEQRASSPTPCGFTATFDARATAAGAWLIGIEFGHPTPGTAGLGPVPVSSPPTPDMTYDLSLGCQPRC